MAGAARLAGEACLRVGAGLARSPSRPRTSRRSSPGCPNSSAGASKGRTELPPLIERAQVIAIGPGLGRSDWALSVLRKVLGTDKPLVVDADALNLIALHGAPPRDGWILTPHPGEAARLLAVSTEDIQHDRLTALDRLLERYGGTIVLKGAGTLVGTRGQTPGICERGNPGMASAGMGDVLTGTIAGLLAQCRDLALSARAGVLAHAMAGDAAARSGERGLLAGDVARELRGCVNL